jgi:sulfur carrier protein
MATQTDASRDGPQPQREITLNGERVLTRATTLAALLSERGFAGKVATARNGTFVASAARAATPLASGDHIEVVSARQGG